MTLFQENVPQKRKSEREREKETHREKERNKERKKKEREWASKAPQCTTGCISLIGFARSVNVHNSIWLV